MVFTLISTDTDVRMKQRQYKLVWLPAPIVTEDYVGICSGGALKKQSAHFDTEVSAF